jgi:hypothetical protein
MALYINFVEMAGSDDPRELRNAYKRDKIRQMPMAKRKAAEKAMEMDEDCDEECYEEYMPELPESVSRVTPKVTKADLPPSVAKKAGPPIKKIPGKKRGK